MLPDSKYERQIPEGPFPKKTQWRRIYTPADKVVLWRVFLISRPIQIHAAVDTEEFLFYVDHWLIGWSWGSNFTLIFPLLLLSCIYLHCKVFRTCWKDIGLNKPEVNITWSLKSLACWWIELLLINYFKGLETGHILTGDLSSPGCTFHTSAE